MNGPSTVLRDDCLACLRKCDIEVEHDGYPFVPKIDGLLRRGRLHVHNARCLMCGVVHPRLYWPGEIVEASRSAVYAAA